jgi:hypothetical protein
MIQPLRVGLLISLIHTCVTDVIPKVEGDGQMDTTLAVSSAAVSGVIVDKDIPFINNYSQTQTQHFNLWLKTLNS